MYAETERDTLQNQIFNFIESHSEFEGLIQIGSAAQGFTDIYSDIDLMAGVFSAEDIPNVNEKLFAFFTDLGASYIEKRAWTSTALGISAYFSNGLSVDISFMPTDDIPIKSPSYKTVISKSEKFSETVLKSAAKLPQKSKYGINDSIHYRFINELRYAEIAILRGQIFFADITLSNARQLLLAVETVRENKKLHQFKAYNDLDSDFLNELKLTYPKLHTSDAINESKNQLLALYRKTVDKCDFLNFDDKLLSLIGCFD